MKIDFETPDSISQLTALQKLLFIQNPTSQEIAMALLLVIRIFYENRPGKLHNKTDYSISGTGCHNPYSYRNGETLKWVWRLELEMEHAHDFHFDLSYEIVQNGLLTANIHSKGWWWTVIADIEHNKTQETLTPKNIVVTGEYSHYLMQELRAVLHEPLSQLIAIQQPESFLVDTSQDVSVVVSENKQTQFFETPEKKLRNKKFALEVRNRLPKRYGGYFSPVATAEQLEFQQKIFEQLQQAKTKFKKGSAECKNAFQEILDPLMLRLQSSVPSSLAYKVNKRFVFTQADADAHKKTDLQELFLNEIESSIGINILTQLPFSNDEINELNAAWYPFIHINPQLHYFRIYRPETFAQKHAKRTQEILELIRQD